MVASWQVCGRCDREAELLLCDGCDLGYHLDCLAPALSTVPVDEWFCPTCAPHVLVEQLVSYALRYVIFDS